MILGIFYLLIAWLLGIYFGRYFFYSSFFSREKKNLFFVIIGFLLIGIILLTWLSYLFSYFFRFTVKPLFYGNLFSIFAALLLVFLREIFSKNKRSGEIFKILKGKNWTFSQNFSSWLPEVCIFLFILLFAISLSFFSFYFKDNKLHIGISVFSDFGPHLAVIRSFSFGKNFPTEYPHFPNGQMRYHFLFYFLVGNLEFLGLRIDWALNLISVLALVSFLILLYQFATLLSGKKIVGFFTILLLCFRSSFAFFTFLEKIRPKSLKELWLKILENTILIGETPHEEWGLWTQKVFANQRHLPLGLAILIFLLMVFFPLFQEMFQKIKEEKNFKRKIFELFNKSSWLIEDWKRAIGSGIILGLLAYWNGTVVISALFILFFLALFSKHRSEFLICALITIFLAFLQSVFFIGFGEKVITPEIYLGFLAREYGTFSLKSWVLYYLELLGVFPILILISLFFLSIDLKILSLAFFAPFIFANTIKLTPDINVNHKLILISVYFLNILVATLLAKFFESPRGVNFCAKLLSWSFGLLLIFLLTITGFVDLITFYNLNKSPHQIIMDTKDPLLIWAKENTSPNDIFLTDIHSLHPILLAGRKIFYGWPYYAWSAGYDTQKHELIMKEIYGGRDIEKIKKLLKENQIKYVVIEESNRYSSYYFLNEEMFSKNFELVYFSEIPEIKIYKVN